MLITSLAMVFATMTSYVRARAESFIPKCKVGFMERPERIVLFMIGAFTNRMAAVMWVIGVLSIVTVIDRIFFTYIELQGRRQPRLGGPFGFLCARSTGPTSARRSPTTCGSSRSSRSSGSRHQICWAIPGARARASSASSLHRSRPRPAARRPWHPGKERVRQRLDLCWYSARLKRA